MLINADNNQDIALLQDGAVISLSALQTSNLNIRADTTASVESVRFGLNGNANYRTENVAPYALQGDNGGNYYAWSPGTGNYSLTVTAYSGDNASGTAGVSISINFSIVN